jgi:hypothetical protein
VNGNVKTVKEQTFHKRPTNVPISNRNEAKTFEFVPEFVLSNEIIIFDPGEQICMDLIETICFQEDKFGNDYKKFWFRFKTVAERLSFRF